MTVHHALLILVAFLSCFLRFASLPKPWSAQHKVYIKDGEKVAGMLYRLAILSWWQSVGIIFNLLPKLPPGFAVIHIWDLAEEQSPRHTGCCEVCLWCPLSAVPTAMQAQPKVGSGSFLTSGQVPDQLSRFYLSGLSLMQLCLPDTCLSLYTVVFKETFSSVIFWNNAMMFSFGTFAPHQE